MKATFPILEYAVKCKVVFKILKKKKIKLKTGTTKGTMEDAQVLPNVQVDSHAGKT